MKWSEWKNLIDKVTNDTWYLIALYVIAVILMLEEVIK